MSLLGSLQIANNSLYAQQVGLQVVANNIANANTPGYIRQQVVLKPAPTQTIGDLALGLGVEVAGIVQHTDRFLSERLRNAVSDLSSSEAQEETYLELEALIGELADADLSTSLNNFFGSLHDILNQPEDAAVRRLAALQGAALTDDIRRLDRRVRDVQSNINDEVVSTGTRINRLVEEIATLNVKIVVTEGSGSRASDAVGLRDQREVALNNLSELIGIRVVEQGDGAVTVFAGGDYLVFEGQHRSVQASYASDIGFAAATIHVSDTDSPLAVSSGKLAGLYAARDDILGGFLDGLQDFTSTLIHDFNRIYSSGQGLSGYRELTSLADVSDSGTALDQLGLPLSPVNGSFQFQVRNTRTGETHTTDVFVELNGLDDDTTLADLAATLDAVEGISATVTAQRKLRIESESPLLEFSFAADTSGALAALGLNTFFTGSTSRDLGVNNVVRQDSTKFAASRGGVGVDTQQAALLAEFGNQPLDSAGGRSLVTLYEDLVGGVSQASAVTRAVTEGFRVFQRTLEGQQLGISGVSIDDEAVKMITYQRAYQATARFIATINELLNTLVNL